MRIRTWLLAILVLVSVGVVGGSVLAKTLSAAPTGAPAAQVVAGQLPLTFQGYLLTSSGQPVVDRVYSATFSIYDSDRGGRRLWSEPSSISPEDGLFTITLGEIEGIDPATFSENRETYLSIAIESQTELRPRIKMSYVPYAVHATSADSVREPPPNPNQVAVKRWFTADRANFTITAEIKPSAIAFDGEGIWVASLDDDEDDPDLVQKFSVVDGDLLKVVRVEESPSAIAYGGGEIWITNEDSDSIVRVNTDGSGKKTFDSKGDRPVDVAFDGLNMWVVNQNSNNVVKFDVTNDAIFEVIPVGSSPAAVAFDGTNIWVTHSGSDNITRIDARSGNEVDRLRAGVGREDIVFDGNNMWVVNENDDSVTKVRATDGLVLNTISVGDRPVAAVFDSANLWVVNQISDNITKIRVSDGAVLGTFEVGELPADIAFDGTNVWVVNQGSDTVVRR